MEFIDYVAAGLPLLQQTDQNRWKLGDLASDFEIKLGRPSDPSAPTLSDLAGAWNVETQRVSEWRSVARFYPDNLRMFGDLITWGHYNQARMASKGDVDLAVSQLQHAEKMHLGIAAFKRWLAGVYYEGEIDAIDLPKQVYGCLPEGTQKVWIVISKIAEESR